MSCSQPDAWCHRMKLQSKGCKQVTVLFAVIIIYSNKCQVHEKQKTFSRLENYLVLRHSFTTSQTIGGLYCPKKYKQPAPSNVFLNGVHVQFFDLVKYLGVRINASLKDDDDIQRQVKSLYYDAANKLRGTFDQCSRAVKSTLFHAYCMPMYAYQL